MTAMRARLIALALAPLLVAVACSSGSSGKSGGTSAAAKADTSTCPVHALDKVTKPVEITFWQSGLSQSLGEAIKTMVANYNSSQQKVHVTM
ncbi:MAG: hypothetical protein QOJ09_2737, partial [Actinomycetota bacterium]|nr:hypothetical protein [Actinomycetota bacterium]